jgi:hypothetical protein
VAAGSAGEAFPLEESEGGKDEFVAVEKLGFSLDSGVDVCAIVANVAVFIYNSTRDTDSRLVHR